MIGNRRFAASTGDKSHYFTDGFTSHIRGWAVGVEVKANRGDGKVSGSSKDQYSVSFDVSITGGSLEWALKSPSQFATVSYDKKTDKYELKVRVWAVMLKADDGTFEYIDLASSLTSAKAKWESHCPGEYEYQYQSVTNQYAVIGTNNVLYGIITEVWAN